LSKSLKPLKKQTTKFNSKMREKLITLTFKRALLIVGVSIIALGACKSKKKAVQPEPEPAPVERVEETPPPAPAAPSEEEVAVKT